MKRIFFIVICSIVLALGFILIRTEGLAYLMKSANFGAKSLEQKEQVDRLFIGSSMFLQGIDGRVLSEDGKVSYVLSYNGLQPCIESEQLEMLIDNNVNIKSLFIDMYAYSIISEPNMFDTRIMQGISIEEQIDIFKALSVNPDYGFTRFYQMIIQANNEIFITWPFYYPIVNSRYNEGTAITMKLGNSKDVLESSNPEFTNESELNKHQINSIYKIIKLCNSNNIDLYFVETPKYKSVYNTFYYNEIMKNYIASINSNDCKIILSSKTAEECALNKSNKYTVYNFEYDNPSYFQDLLHLSSEGKKIFSEIVFDFIK